MSGPARTGPVDVLLVAGGLWHDTGFARLQLLALLDADDAVRVTVRDVLDPVELSAAAVLVTYLCEVPLDPFEDHLLRWLAAGGRWLALHATCSALDVVPGPDRLWFRARASAAHRVLGGSFLAHPPIGTFTVAPVSADTLVADLDRFTTTDELYVCRLDAGAEVLLATTFGGTCPGFLDPGTGEEVSVQEGPQPVLWRRRRGRGEALVLTLGHCRGRWDLADLGVNDSGGRDRRAWQSAGFDVVLRRCVRSVTSTVPPVGETAR